MSSYEVKVYPPLVGVFVDLSLVPDPVFAKKLVGDGFAIDPFENKIYSPIDGTVKSVHKTKHAITLTSDYGFDILVHLGLETVNLNGQGFNVLVKDGDKVKHGDILTEFDMDYVATNAVSLITPVLCMDIDFAHIKLEIMPQDVTDLNQPIMKVLINQCITTKKTSPNDNLQIKIESKWLEIINQYGIHARPAALLTSIAREFNSNISIHKDDRQADLKSIVSLLALSITKSDKVKVVASGEDALVAINKLVKTIENLKNDEKPLTSLIQPQLAKVLETGKYSGVIAANGIAIAKLVFLDSIKFDIEEHALDALIELTKFENTINNVVKELENEINKLSEIDAIYKNILSAHMMILTDPEIISKTKNLISQLKTAQFAWNSCVLEICETLEETGNQLLIERKNDLIDISNRILTKLCDNASPLQEINLNDKIILVANDFTPSQIIALPQNVNGLVSINGGVTSHVAILAGTKGIPLLMGVSKQIFNEKSQIVILDAQNGIINCQPTELELVAAEQRITVQLEHLKLIQETGYIPCITQDAVTINCMANIGNLEDAKIAIANGADGIGLFRTEFIYLESKQAPSEEQQVSIYSIINQLLNGKTFIIRTLDIGGDKTIPYLNQSPENNPMLGVRGIRLCLANQELLKTQLTAILKVNSANIKIMIPMISKIEEYREVKKLFKDLSHELNYKGNIELGIMVEVPSVAFMSEVFAAEVDFMSIGTNDLTQYVMAVDREHIQLGKETDHLHPAVLKAIAATIKGAQKYQISLSVCGLMASERLAIVILLGLGVTNLSMTANSVAENKAFIRNLNIIECKKIASYCLALSTAQEVKNYLVSCAYIRNLE